MSKCPPQSSIISKLNFPQVEIFTVLYCTDLHRAARLGRTECVAILLKAGNNHRAHNERGESAFDVAGMYTEQVRVDKQQYLNQLSREVKTAIEKSHTAVLAGYAPLYVWCWARAKAGMVG